MVDADLALLYGVPTKRLNEQVKRNLSRFPEDFMFQLSESEKEKLIAESSDLSRLKFSSSLPYVFTEHGVVMLVSVLNSDRAIEVNVLIVRIFVRMRELLLNYKDILIKVERLEKKSEHYDEEIRLIFTYLKQLLNPKVPASRKIGFRQVNDS